MISVRFDFHCYISESSLPASLVETVAEKKPWLPRLGGGQHMSGLAILPTCTRASPASGKANLYYVFLFLIFLTFLFEER